MSTIPAPGGQPSAGPVANGPVPMLAAERQQHLLTTLRTFGRINAATAVQELNASAETIRKDLIALEQRGLLRRVHGGALHVESMTFEPDVSARQEHSGQKDRIAMAAVAHLPESGAVLIDAGSTTRAFVDHLPNRSLTVYTNALAIALAAAPLPNVSVATFGGRVRPSTTAEVGSFALLAIRQMHFDVAFVGANAISVEHGLSTPDPDEAAIKAEMIANSERVVLLTDHSKFAQRSLVRYAEVADLDLIITGTELGQVHKRALDSSGIEVQYV
ncbi:MAG: DeoR/GlpR family DNA-binding transcription regulator [Beutenbergiaceae bacterium]